MSTSLRSPLSPRACSRLAQSLLAQEVPADTLWAVEAPGVDAPAQYVAAFELVDDLIGFDGRTWRALALVANSTISGVESTICFVQSSCGCAAVAVSDDAGQVSGVDITGGVDGFISDISRRILGLDTPIEPTPPIDAVLASWLTIVLDIASDVRTRHLVTTWRDVVAIHPLADMIRLTDEFGDPLSPGELAQRCFDRVGWWSWQWIRDALLNGELGDESSPLCHDIALSADELAWMDTGMFARWTLGLYREVDELLNDCSLFLERAVYERLLCAVRTGHR